MGGRSSSFPPLSYGWEEEVNPSIELWDGGGGHSLHLVMGGRRRSFPLLSYGLVEELIPSIELWVGGGAHSLN